MKCEVFRTLLFASSLLASNVVAYQTMSYVSEGRNPLLPMSLPLGTPLISGPLNFAGWAIV